MHSEKAPAKQSAIQEGTEFFLHEGRNVPVALTLSGQKCFQMSGDDSIKRTGFGVTRLVSGFKGHAVSH